MNNPAYHVPALLTETVGGLNIRPDGVYVDCTFGGGGHAREILKHLGDRGRLLGFDQDEEAAANAPDDARFLFVRSNFRYLRNFLKFYDIPRVDGIVADLGVSFHHFDAAERGFSFRYEGMLDMRMNQQSERTAADVLNQYPEEKLADVFYVYGELRQARKLARAIVQTRERVPFASIGGFVEVLKPFFTGARENKDMARVFQALRIEVNQEMEALKSLLYQSVEVLSDQGRLVVLTYHSLEDRMVKHFIRTGNVEGRLEKDFYGRVRAPFKAVNNKVIVAGEAEIARNPRARSAKLRIATLNRETE